MSAIRDGFLPIMMPVKVPVDVLASSEGVQWDFEAYMIAAMHQAREKALAGWPETWKRLQKAYEICGIER
jgi:hypothetical protein